MLRGTEGEESKLSKVSSSSEADGFDGFLLKASTASVDWILCSDIRSGLGFVSKEQRGRIGRTYRYKEVADCRGEIQQPFRPQRLHQLRDAAELMEVVGDADKGEDKKHVLVTSLTVFPEDVEHLAGILVTGYHASVRAFAEEVEEAVGGMAVVAGVGEEGELTVAVGC